MNIRRLALFPLVLCAACSGSISGHNSASSSGSAATASASATGSTAGTSGSASSSTASGAMGSTGTSSSGATASSGGNSGSGGTSASCPAIPDAGLGPPQVVETYAPPIPILASAAGLLGNGSWDYLMAVSSASDPAQLSVSMVGPGTLIQTLPLASGDVPRALSAAGSGPGGPPAVIAVASTDSSAASATVSFIFAYDMSHAPWGPDAGNPFVVGQRLALGDGGLVPADVEVLYGGEMPVFTLLRAVDGGSASKLVELRLGDGGYSITGTWPMAAGALHVYGPVDGPYPTSFLMVGGSDGIDAFTIVSDGGLSLAAHMNEPEPNAAMLMGYARYGNSRALVVAGHKNIYSYEVLADGGFGSPASGPLPGAVVGMSGPSGWPFTTVLVDGCNGREAVVVDVGSFQTYAAIGAPGATALTCTVESEIDVMTATSGGNLLLWQVP